MTGQDGKRLGEYVVQRREQLGMRTTKALADKVKMTPRALGDVENGRRTNYSAGTKARLEIALEWRPGSIDEILAGGEPKPVRKDRLHTLSPMPEPEASVSEYEQPVIVHAATHVWEAVNALADSPDGDPDRRRKARSAVASTADILTDLLLSRNAGVAAKPLIQSMAHRAIELINEARKEVDDDVETTAEQDAPQEGDEGEKNSDRPQPPYLDGAPGPGGVGSNVELPRKRKS